MSERIGIIVDGDGDFASLKKRFSYGFQILKTDGPRGHTAQISDIASRSKKQISILRAFRCSRLVIVLDFEERSCAYEEFVHDLQAAFDCLNHGTPVLVVVTNRMIENWYLADIEYLSKKKSFIRDGLKQKNYEGTHGKAEIKKCMSPGFSYSETKHGPQMFEILRFDIAGKNSSSFKEFLSAVDAN